MENDDKFLYANSRALSYAELVGIYNGFIYQFDHTSWFNLKKKIILYVAIGVLQTLLV